MKLFLSFLISMTLMASAIAQTEEVRQYENGSLSGQLENADGSRKDFKNAAVFICDTVSGYPLVAKTGRPFTDDQPVLDPQQLLFALTDETGRFEFEKIPVGKYRLVAQSWQDAEGVRWMKDDDRPLILHGRATVEIIADRETTVSIRPLGNAKLKIQTTPDEGNAFLLVSLGPPLGEPILAFLGWGDKFLHNIVGVTHMKRGTTEIHGLPANSKIHLSYFNYDNNPGIGGVSADPTRDSVATIPVYASWSNGYYATPAHMQPLVDFLETNQPFLPELLNPGAGDEFKTERGQLDRKKFYAWVKSHATDEVEIESQGTVRVMDVMAANAYLRIRKHHEARKSNRR